MTQFSVKADDSHEIPVYEWLPSAEPVAVLHITHGLAEYAQRYDWTARKLNEAGIAVYAHDHRGHGDAIKSIDELGYSGDQSFVRKVDDLRLLLQKERQQYPGKKLFLLGHSMGSFISQYFFQHFGKEIDGLILSSSNGIADPLLSLGIAFAKIDGMIFGKKHKSKILDKLTFGKFNYTFKPNRTTHDWLSRDPSQVDKYVENEKSGFLVSSGLYYDFFRGLKSIFSAENIARIPSDVPVYLFAGDMDPVGLQGTGVIKLAEKWKAAGVRDLEYKLYPGGRHEMLNEINREEVLEDLVIWLRKHL